MTSGKAMEISTGTNDQFPLCSPDGKWVFYRDQMAQALMRVPINGGKPEKLTDRIDTGPAASPFDVSADSRYVVMALTEPASSDYKQKLVIQDLITGKEVATPKLRPSYSALPRFTPDARAIVYLARKRHRGQSLA